MMRTIRLFVMILALCVLAAVEVAATAEGIEAEVCADPVEVGVEELQDTELWTGGAAMEEAPVMAEQAVTAGSIVIDEVHFPEDTFRNYVIKNIDTDEDGMLSDSERLAVTEIDMTYANNLDGIEFFPNLEKLECEAIFEHLDLSGNKALTYLRIEKCSLESIDLSQNTALTDLTIMEFNLTSIDVSHNTELTVLNLNLRGNKPGLTSLDVSKNTKLKELCFNWNKLRAIDLSHNTALEELWCGNNNLEALDVSHNTKLKELHCYKNLLDRLELGTLPDLEYLDCYSNFISELEISGCPSLRSLYCADNPRLSSVYIGDNPRLRTIDCDPSLVLTHEKPTPEPVSIAGCKISGVKAQTYTGSAIKPKPVVTLDGKELTRNVDYKVSYSNNKKIGTATMTVKGIGDYTGSAKKTFKINPKKVKLSGLKAGKKKLTVKWKKGTGGAGYQIQYGTKKDFSSKKTVTITKASTVSKVLKSLKSGKSYYVRIRGYKKVGGKAYVSAWSSVLKKKVK